MKTEYLTEPASRTFLVGLGDVGRLAVASVRAERLSRLLVEPSPRSLAEALPLGPTSLLFVTGVGAYRELARLLRSVRRSAGLVVVVLSADSEEALGQFFGSSQGKQLVPLVDAVVPVLTRASASAAQLLAILLEQARVRGLLVGRGVCPVVLSSARSFPALPSWTENVLWVASRIRAVSESERTRLHAAFDRAFPSESHGFVRVVRRSGLEVTGGLLLPASRPGRPVPSSPSRPSHHAVAVQPFVV